MIWRRRIADDVTLRPERVPFRPVRIAQPDLDSNANWIIRDITIGNRIAATPQDEPRQAIGT